MKCTSLCAIAKAIAMVGVGLLAMPVRAAESCPPDAPVLIVYHAGSLSTAFTALEKVYTERTGVCVVDRAGGSISAAREITAGGAACDLYASADDKVIERMLVPRYAAFDIRFAQGAMVLAYRTTSRQSATIVAPGAAFDPPRVVPEVAPDWYRQLSAAGVVIAGSHPFLDPSGYRADLIFRLAQDRYAMPGLYNTLLGHYAIAKPGDALGKTFDYQFTYEHSARAAHQADTDGTYRYASLPDALSLGSSALDPAYSRRGIVVPGLAAAPGAPTIRIPASRVTWGITLMKAAPHRDNAVRFLELLLSAEGANLQAPSGPEPIRPPAVSTREFAQLPASLKSMVHATPPSR